MVMHVVFLMDKLRLSFFVLFLQLLAYDLQTISLQLTQNHNAFTNHFVALIRNTTSDPVLLQALFLFLNTLLLLLKFYFFLNTPCLGLLFVNLSLLAKFNNTFDLLLIYFSSSLLCLFLPFQIFDAVLELIDIEGCLYFFLPDLKHLDSFRHQVKSVIRDGLSRYGFFRRHLWTECIFSSS